jgi:hypothetical protein
VSDAVFAPVLFFGGGVVMVVALSLTMTALRGIERVRARLGTPRTKPAVFDSASSVPDAAPRPQRHE